MAQELRSLYAILGMLVVSMPRLVLMRGSSYFRIEELWRGAKRDYKPVGSPEHAALSEPIYWTDYDERGKLLLKGMSPKGGEFVTFAEAGSEVPTAEI